MQRSDSTRMGWGGGITDHPTAAVSGHKNPEMGLSRSLDKLLQDLLGSFLLAGCESSTSGQPQIRRPLGDAIE